MQFSWAPLGEWCPEFLQDGLRQWGSGVYVLMRHYDNIRTFVIKVLAYGRAGIRVVCEDDDDTTVADDAV